MVAYKRFRSLGEFADWIGHCIDSVNPVVGRAVNDTSHTLLDTTIPVTPIEFGPLRASGRVVGPEIFGNTIICEIRFGGASAGYAIYVHERVVTKRGHVVYHNPPTRAKFLSSTADTTFPFLQAEVFARSLAIFTETR